MKEIGKHLFLLCMICCSASAYSQRERTLNWYFGENAGLKFKPTLQASTSGSINTNEGCTSISDTCGNLLFYTDGITVYTKNHTVMQNGTGLHGGWSSTESAIIIPKPSNDSLYYIFSNGNSTGMWSYSSVNMKANGGLGAVVQKNDTLCTTSTEKQAAIYHCNGKDVWMIARRVWPLNDYIAFLVTSSGVSANPVISTSSYLPKMDYVGYLRFSPDGKYLVSAHTYVDSVSIFKFNTCTGQLADFARFATADGPYGVSFSADNSKLYLATTMQTQTTVARIFQFDMSSGQAASIVASGIVVATAAGNNYYGAIQLGPDNRIYVTKYRYSGYSVKYLGVIDKPTLNGTACNFQDTVISLGGKNLSLGLPLFNESYFNVEYKCLAPPQPTSNVGVGEFWLQQPVDLWPNPFSDKITIRVSDCNEKILLRVMNASGQIVREVSVNCREKLEVACAELPRGLYFYRVETDAGSFHVGRIVAE